MLLRLLCLAVFCLGGPAQLLAQTYEPGYLVRSTGDTLRGEIENEFWEQPPTFIRFRAAAGSPSELLKPRQLRAVSFINGRYFRHEVLLLDHAAETRLQDLVRGNAVAMQSDTLLAEVLLTGPVELLRVALPGAVHYEVRRPGQPPLRLSERQYLGENDRGGWSVMDGNNYRRPAGAVLYRLPRRRAGGPHGGLLGGRNRRGSPGLRYQLRAGRAPAQLAGAGHAPSAQRVSGWRAGPAVRLNRTQSPAYVVGDENADGPAPSVRWLLRRSAAAQPHHGLLRRADAEPHTGG